MSEWRTIDTAPRDGTPILGYVPDDEPTIVVIRRESYEDESWWGYVEVLVAENCDAATPTHWMPLPAPPSEAT